MLFRKTVDSIVADIAEKIDHLYIAATNHDTDAGVHAAKIEHHTVARDDARAESARARRLASKFSDLIN
jgi:hypothetical protein